MSDDIRQRAEQADALAKRAIDLVHEQSDRIDELASENEELRQRIADLEEANAVVSQVNENRALDVDDRAVLCLQTLANDAGRDGKATMTVSEGWSTLGREFDRTRMYDVLRRAEALVDDDDVCWFQKESRGHQPPSRLILDRSAGDLPETAAGKQLSREVSR